MTTKTTKKFDPNAAAAVGSGIFGLPTSCEDARVVLMPVPWEVTTSSGGGTSRGPAAILEASKQVDLFDRFMGKPYEAGIHMLAPARRVVELNRKAKAWAAPIIARGGDVEGYSHLKENLERVNAAGEELDTIVYERTRELLHAGKIVGIVGGDHATPFGAMRAYAEHAERLSILHIDAHADLRCAFEGFTRSHASIMYNVMNEIPQVFRLVQVGIRDFCEEEFGMIEASNGRIQTFFDRDVARRLQHVGGAWYTICQEIVEVLPSNMPVYVSFDIDGLDPTLCPNTGTPVPGGLSYNQALTLIEEVARHRRIVGFDLNEVAPGEHDNGWNGNVAARLLYQLIGWTLHSQS